MKKLFYFLVLMMVCTTMSAQYREEIECELKVSVNISKPNIFDNDINIKAGVGPSVGFLIKLPLPKDIFIKTGFGFTQKPFKSKETEFLSTYYYDVVVEAKERVNPGYISFPIIVGYDIPLNDKVKFDIGFGPCFSAGISGKYKIKERSTTYINFNQTYVETETYTFDLYDDLEYNRFDFGFHVTGGLTVNKIHISYTFEPSITRMNQFSIIRANHMNHNFSVGVIF